MQKSALPYKPAGGFALIGDAAASASLPDGERCVKSFMRPWVIVRKLMLHFGQHNIGPISVALIQFTYECEKLHDLRPLS